MWGQSNDFWNTRDEWARSVRSGQAKARTQGRALPPTLQSKANYWKSYTRRMSAVRGRSGVVSFDVDPGYTRLVQDLLGQIAPQLASAYDRELSRVMLDAFHQWPVWSGLSKASLDLGFEQISDTEVAGVLGCRAPYTTYIKNSPHLRLIRTPALVAGSRILEGLNLG